MRLSRRFLLHTGLLAAVAPALDRLPFVRRALAQAPEWRHGLSLFDDVKYPPSFKQFDYVNAQAPKAGATREKNWPRCDGSTAIGDLTFCRPRRRASGD